MVTRLRVQLAVMGCTETDEDEFSPKVCSGRGECGPNNSCICEIRYTGYNCLDYNKSYHAGECNQHTSSTFVLVQGQLSIQLIINSALKLPTLHKRYFFCCRSVGDLLRRCIYLTCAAANLLLRSVQTIEKSFLPQSLSNNNTEVTLLRCVPCVSSPSRLLHSTRIASPAMGLLPDVSILPVTDDVRLASRLFLGGGKSSFYSTLLHSKFNW